MDFDPGLANILCTRFGAVMYHLRFGIYTSINAKPTIPTRFGTGLAVLAGLAYIPTVCIRYYAVPRNHFYIGCGWARQIGTF